MIVVDCSAVVGAMAEADGQRASEILSGERLMAPHLIDAEVVSAIRGLVMGHQLSHHHGHDVLDLYDDLPLTRWTSGLDLRRRAFDLRDNFTAYDAAYVVLAEALECPLVTRDKRLAKAATRLIDVILV